MKNPRRLITLYLLWIGLAPAPELPAQNPAVVIEGATLIDGNGGPPVADTTIIIEGNRIRSITQGEPVSRPAGAQVIDAHGKYMLPGLWDTHTHYHDWFAELLITNGVTSVLGYGGGPWLNAQSEGTDSGKIYGPRFFLSQGTIGMIYMMEDPEMIASNLLEGREDAIKHVRDLASQGSKIIKVYTSLTPADLQAVTEEAHRQGLKVSGHIGFGAREAALAGIDNLAHATGLPIPDLLKPEDLEKLSDMRAIDTGRLRVVFPQVSRPWDETTQRWGPNADIVEYPLFIEDPRRLMAFGLMDQALARDLIDLLVRENVFIESCIGYIFRNIHDRVEEYRAEDVALLSGPELGYIPERYRMNILDYSLNEQFRPDELRLMREGYRNFQWFMKTFLEAGGKVTTGMDTASTFHATMMPGLAVHREMQLLVDAGVPAMKAIQAATKWSAELLQQEGELGTIEEGKLADLILLRSNPLADIAAFREIEMVMKDGRVMRRGYHSDYSNPIPESPAYQLRFPDWTVSEIPTQIRSLSPQIVDEGSESFTLTVIGREFVSSSVVQFAGETIETRYVGPDELSATVPAVLVEKVGTYPVQIIHRAPGWGKTNTVNFYVKFR